MGGKHAVRLQFTKGWSTNHHGTCLQFLFCRRDCKRPSFSRSLVGSSPSTLLLIAAPCPKNYWF